MTIGSIMPVFGVAGGIMFYGIHPTRIDRVWSHRHDPCQLGFSFLYRNLVFEQCFPDCFYQSIVPYTSYAWNSPVQ